MYTRPMHPLMRVLVDRKVDGERIVNVPEVARLCIQFCRGLESSAYTRAGEHEEVQ